MDMSASLFAVFLPLLIRHLAFENLFQLELLIISV